MFPPLGGPGVQRSLKLAKYAPRYGWSPVILSVKEISYYVYDPNLIDELPPETPIFRTESLDPLRVSYRLLAKLRGRRPAETSGQSPFFATNAGKTKAYRKFRDMLLFPDAQVLWAPFATRMGARLIEQYKPKVIYCPAAPLSAVTVARKLRKRYGIPYVLDFRDGWTFDSFRKLPTNLHKAADRRREAAAVRDAASIVTVGPTLTRWISERYPERADDVHTIFNGFDPAAMEGAELTQAEPGVFRFVHCGSLFDYLRKPFLSFLQALSKLPREQSARVEVLMVGQVYAEAKADVEAAGLAEQVRFLGYIAHPKALGLMRSAHVNLIFRPENSPDAVSGRVFDLLMVGRPILGIMPKEGDCAYVLNHSGLPCLIFEGDEAEAELAKQWERIFAWENQPTVATEASQFSRPEQSRQFAELFDRAAGKVG